MTAVYFFAGILLVLLAAVLVAPLLDRQPRGGVSDPEERLGAALETLRELEFEHETGKIDDEDYHRLRAEYAAAAIAARDAGATAPVRADDRRRGAAKSACGVCGAPTAADAKFCSRCGTPVGEAVTSPGGHASGEEIA